MSGNGYRVLTILKHRTSSHRVVWFFENNSYPSGQIDHIDGNVLNNKISNLRDVTPRRNSLNRLIHRTGKMPGCYLSKRSNRIKKWTSVITVFGVKYSLGYFRSAREASEKYKEAVVFIEQNSFRKFNKKYGSKIISIKKRAVIGSHFTRNR